MPALRLATVSRNYFNVPIWIALHEGLFAAEGLDVPSRQWSLHRGIVSSVVRARERWY
jgi:hypothetical protein